MKSGTGSSGEGHPAGAETFAAFLEEMIRAEGVPGLSVAVAKGDSVVWARGFGIADLATSTSATPQTGYLWFSMTKIATATAVVRLAEEGEARPRRARPTSTTGDSRSCRSLFR